jgi:hypothetical protein
VTAFELLMALPVLLILMTAVLEYGLILANLKYLPLASRAGAKVLAETPRWQLMHGPSTLVQVSQAVEDSLSAGDIVACRVLAEHNVDGGWRQEIGSCTGTDPSTPLPPVGAGAVRVTVCVELSELTPDFLGWIGFSTAGRVAQATTTFPYEDPS